MRYIANIYKTIDMKIVNFDETPSLMSQYMSELRNVKIQNDMLRFRRNLERIGEIMAYEISKTIFPYSARAAGSKSRRRCTDNG